MKNTIFTVPEGYFAKAEDKIVLKAGRIRKRWIGALCACAVVTVGVLWLNPSKETSTSDPSTYQQDLLADSSCDIFLEIFEY